MVKHNARSVDEAAHYKLLVLYVEDHCVILQTLRKLLYECWVAHVLIQDRKHYQTHYKHWTCNVPGCTRRDGFGTKNDLDRHVNSVHRRDRELGSQSGFICVACPHTQNGRPKFWPRKDNFKAHIKRKHPHHDTEGVILRYVMPLISLINS